MSPEESFYLGIDVGTGSVRAALYTSEGKQLRRSVRAIRKRHTSTAYYEQSTEDIWVATVEAVREACAENGHQVRGIGCDATCSLVAVDRNGAPLSVVEDSQARDTFDGQVWNVILWLDHRAEQDANYINGLEHAEVKAVLRTFGGKLSPENEPPKLRWLKRNLPHVVRDAVFFDLADWLVYSLTGSMQVRSACTVSCKWGWGAMGDGWMPQFWDAIGVPLRIEQLGADVRGPGEAAGGLSVSAASELGLPTSCVVAVPMIDAHCGAVGILGARGAAIDSVPIHRRLAMIAGTSTCYIAVAPSRIFVPGVWGPFCDAVLPGTWCTEAGQSVSGHLLHHIVTGHAAYPSLVSHVGIGAVFDELNRTVLQMMEEDGGRDPAQDVHILDSFAGNRSPYANAAFRGVISGLELSSTERELAVLYRATVQALCYGARLIVETMNTKGYCVDKHGMRIDGEGHNVEVILVCGGVIRNEMLLQELADITGMRIMLNREEDPTLLGGAMLAAKAHLGEGRKLEEQMQKMSRIEGTVKPRLERRMFHDKKYHVYKLMHEHFLQYRAIMRD